VNLSCLLPLLRQLPIYRQVVRRLATADTEREIAILDAAKPFLIAGLYEDLGFQVLAITPQPEDARRLHEQLQFWCSPSASLYRFTEPDPLSYRHLPTSPTPMLERTQALAALTVGGGSDRPPLIVSSALAAISKTMPPEEFTSACHTLTQGMAADPQALLLKWQHLGYEAEDIVEVPGTMSKRGGIIDIFPASGQWPVRLEFMGKKVESIRLFNPADQRSTQHTPAVTITPTRGALNTANIIDYLDADNSIVVIDSPEETKVVVDRLNKEALEFGGENSQMGESPAQVASFHFAWEELERRLRTRKRLILQPWNSSRTASADLPFTLPQRYGGRLESFLEAAKETIEARRRLVVVTHQANRLAELLQEAGLYSPAASEIDRLPPHGSLTLIHGSLAQGWVMSNELTVVTDAELFGFVKQPRPIQKTPVRRRWLLPQLEPGDYVAHVDHGIGRFTGLSRLSTNRVEREYLVLQYAAGDRLYVPTDQIGRLTRYVGTTDRPPALSRLGTHDWHRTRSRVKESVADIARALLALYAAREVTIGFAFSPDTLWQQELEASFPYVETPDQAEAMAAVKDDMESPKPMDRLICGDVGYGKTEVALRAAFKAVMDGKQVAVLVPTTVLAQQHFTTFGERLQAFPVRVEMLSRFCSQEQEARTVQGMASGAVDICIGTHRLLQKDIAFRDLGLAIIDEEQRFGVAQKERLKHMRKEVNVLTLSATPIPRTLHMSLTGIRDMSIMETPPEERLSIKTYVGAYDATLVRQAVLRELERNGQVFYVHNRVQDIAPTVVKLQALLPEARIAIAHGQMPEDRLERVMIDFIAGKHDVLVATTIVQLGLDMPSVNTLVVDQADKYGLTQLYQLRGRVGRGVNQAYAYFLFDKGKYLAPQAHKRLRTIFEATELGAGFGVAVKDLEIRGAGDLLGARQSGHIAAVGFDLYSQMLAEAVEELRAAQSGETRRDKDEPTTSVALPLPAYIPQEYVPGLATRLSLYAKLASINRTEEVKTVAQELEDRFGRLPPPVENLLQILEIKILAARAGVESIRTHGRQIVLSMAPGNTANMLAHLTEYADAIRITTAQIRLDLKRLGSEWQMVLKRLLQG